MMIELVTLVFTPSCMGSIQRLVLPSEDDLGFTANGASRIMLILCWVQIALLVIGLFCTQASISKRNWYNNTAPKVIWWMLFTAMLILPWVIIVFAICKQIGEGTLLPYFLLVCWLELGLFVWTITDFLGVIRFTYECSVDKAIAIATLRARCQAYRLVVLPEQSGERQEGDEDDKFKSAVDDDGVGFQMLEQLDTQEQFDQLKKPLAGEGELDQDATKLADDLLQELSKSYDEVYRGPDDGQINFGTSLVFMQDFFAYSFLYQLRRRVIYDDGEDSDPEPEADIGADKKVEDEDKDDGAPKREESAQGENKKQQMTKAYDVYSSHRISITAKFYLLVAAQLILLWYMLIQAVTDDEIVENLTMPCEAVSTIIGRFVCAFIMHITLTAESKQGLKMMKYAANHHWKFRSWGQAYWIGLFQVTVLNTCEFVNLVLLTTNHSMLDIIMNFLAIVVITEFDDAFFFIVQNEELAVLLTDGEYKYERQETGETKTITCAEIFTIQTTTSNYAKMRVPGNKLRKIASAEDALVQPTATA